MAETINDGGPAFPVPETQWNNFMPGMTLRAYFAGQALEGLMAAEYASQWDHIRTATCAVLYADALLAELAKEEA